MLSNLASLKLNRSFTLGVLLAMTLTSTTACSSLLTEPEPTPEGEPEPGATPEEPEPSVAPEPGPGEPDQPTPEPQPEPQPQPDGEPGPQPEPTPEPQPTPEPTPTPDPEPGELTVDPADLSFEGIEVRSGTRQTVTITNGRSTSVQLSQVELEADSQAFIIEPLDLPLTINSGDSLDVDVYFRPLAAIGLGYQNTMRIVVQNDLIEVALAGQGTSLQNDTCVRFNPASTRVTGPGNPGQGEATLENCGNVSIDVDDLEIIGDDGFTGIIVSNTDELAPGETVPVGIRLVAGEDAQVARTAYAIMDSGRDDPGGIAILKISSGPACPEVRAEAVGTLPEDEPNRGAVVAGLSGDFFELSADVTTGGFPNADRPMTWEASPPPNGSGEFFADETERQNFYTAQGGGLHQLTVVPTRENGSVLEGCPVAQVTLDVFPEEPAMLVELAWQGAPDLDLHLLRDDGNNNFGEVFGENSCYWGQQYQRDFGTPGFLFDGAYLEADITDGSDNERIRLGAFEDNRAYKVGVRRGQFFEEADVQVTVTIGDVTETLSTALSGEGDQATWIPFVIRNGQIEIENTFE